MPTSTYSQLTTVVRYLEAIRPASILDIGLGNGKMGFIARDLLDVMHGERYRRADWRTRIDGIEVFADYIQAHQRALYDDIQIGDAFDVIDRLGSYDVIIIGDVLEHFERGRAEAFLDKCCDHCTTAMILSIPLGEKWIQGPIYGNSYERHLSFWSAEELQVRATEAHFFEFETLGAYGTFLIRRDDYRHFQGRRDADQLAGAGEAVEAAETLKRLVESLPPNLNTYLQLAELLVRRGDTTAAIACLNRARRHFPEQEALRHFVEQLRAIPPPGPQAPSEASTAGDGPSVVAGGEGAAPADEAHGRFHEDWYSDSQIAHLVRLARYTTSLSGAVVEIGCWEGKSTTALANACFPDTLIAVDNWLGNRSEGADHATVQILRERDVYGTFLDNIRRMTRGNVTVEKADCLDFLTRFDEPIKFCHIDAGHDYEHVKRTLELTLPKVVPGGVLCGDDHQTANATRTDLKGGVERACRELLGDYYAVGNLWFWRKAA